MAYNLTMLNTGNNILEYSTGINNAIGGHLGTLLLTIMFILLLIVFKNYDTQSGFIASSMITTLFAVLFWGIGWVGFAHIFVPSSLLLAGLMWKALGS